MDTLISKVETIESNQKENYRKVEEASQKTISSLQNARKEMEKLILASKLEVANSLAGELKMSRLETATHIENTTKGILSRLDKHFEEGAQQIKAQRKEMASLHRELTSTLENEGKAVRERVDELRKSVAKLESRPRSLDGRELAGLWKVTELERDGKKEIGIEKAGVSFDFKKHLVIIEELLNKTKIAATYQVFEVDREKTIDIVFPTKHELSVIPMVSKDSVVEGYYRIVDSHLSLLLFEKGRQNPDFGNTKGATLLTLRRQK